MFLLTFYILALTKKNEFWVLYVFQVILINMSSFFEFVSDYDGRLNKAYASTFGLLFRAILHKIHYVQHWPSFYMFLLTFYILALTKKNEFWVLYVFQVILINMSSFFEFVSDYDGRLNKAYASTFGLFFRAILHKIDYIQHWPLFTCFHSHFAYLH